MHGKAVVRSISCCIAILLACGACWKFEPRKTTAVGKDVEAAIFLLSTSNSRQRAKVMGAFALIRQHPQSEALQELLPWLADERPTKRRSAVYALQMLAWEDPAPALPPLRGLLTHSESATRGMSALALGALGDSESFDALVKMLESDKTGYARRCAAWALGELASQEGLAPLEAALGDADDSVVANAENAIERLRFLRRNKSTDPDKQRVIQGVWLISGSVIHHDVRLQRAVEMIRSADPSISRPLLAALASSEVEDIRNSAIYAQKQLYASAMKR